MSRQRFATRMAALRPFGRRAQCLNTRLCRSVATQMVTRSRGPPTEVAEEIKRFGAMKPHPQSIGSVLSCTDPNQLLTFLREEYPIRCAERIELIESLPSWSRIPELREVHSRHWKSFSAIRGVSNDIDSFTCMAKDIVSNNKDVVGLMAEGIGQLSQRLPDLCDTAFVDHFLDTFFMNRIGSNVLLNQYLASVDKTRVNPGTVDPECDVTEICKQTAEEVRHICRYYKMPVPNMSVETHDVTTDENADLKFAFIPGIISYIVQEILKNSCRATLENCSADLECHPINLTVCGDHQRVLIHISDRAGGIPFDATQHVWSYLYTTAKEGQSFLAGYGIGLPVSRLYANYLGGSLNLVSLPGFGTHAYVFFPRLNSDQVETVPDKDHPWAVRSDFVM